MLRNSNIVTLQTDLSERKRYALLKENDLHIWQVSLTPESAMLKICNSFLTSEDKEKVKWFKFEEDRNNYIISKGILRLLLVDYLKSNNSDLVISRQKKGKPFAENDRSLFFNMSDSGKVCVYVFTRVSEVGIDIEQKRLLHDLDELIQRNLTNKEQNFLSKNPSEKAKNFFRFWTIKEAYLKAIGEGMRLTPDNLEFSIENGNIKLMNQQGIPEQENWIIKEFSPKTYYFGALVYKNENTRIKHFII